MNDAAASIKTFNAGRDPERLALKLRKMRSDPFVFLRGSCHLFYARQPAHEVLSLAPAAWICGDLHLENFGSYKGDNRLAYFDINDFDEAVLAPCTWDLVRFLASLRLAAGDLAIKAAQAEQLCRRFVDTYAAALAAGKARWVERETACGLVRDLLDSLRGRSRPGFLAGRTEMAGRHRRIRVDGRKALPVDDGRRATVAAFMQQFALAQADPGFFKVLDVARRIAGTGSLGVERYIILVEGKGSPDGNYLLDLKAALPSSLLPRLPIAQPGWASEAERIVTLQGRMQAIAMAFLHAVQVEGRPYVLRGLQPSEDRVELAAWNGRLRRLEEVIDVMARLTAWAHLRSSGRSGSTNADALVDFGMRTDWRQDLLELAADGAASTLADWRAFCDAFDRGYFDA